MNQAQPLITRLEAKTFAPDQDSPLVQQWMRSLHQWVRVDCGAGGHCAYYCVAKLLKADYSKAFAKYDMEELMKILRVWTAEQLERDLTQGRVDRELLRNLHAFDIRTNKSKRVTTMDIVDGVRTHFWANNLTLGCLQDALIAHGFLLYLMIFDMRCKDAQPIGFVSLSSKPTREGDRLGVLLYDSSDRGGHYTLMGHIHKTPGAPAQVRYGMTLPQLRQVLGNLVHPKMWPNL